MANKQISQLPAATQMNDGDLLVCEQNGIAKRLTGSILMAMINSHGGITNTSYTPPVSPSLEGTLTFTYSDGSTFSFGVMNGQRGATGAQGEKGDPFTYEDFTPAQIEALRGEQGIQGVPGNPGYVHIKWSSVEPTSDADLSDIPDAWMGVYSGDSSTAPTAYTAYSWYEIKGDTGAAGADGTRGGYIWRLRNLPTTVGNSWVIPTADVIPPPFDSEAEVRGGDLAFYGDVYYCFTGETITGGYELIGETYINSAALPEAGTTGQVLAKLSNSSYDVGWVDQTGGDGGIFWAEYNVTALSVLQQHIADGDVVMLDYNSRVYYATYHSENYVYFISVSTPTTYIVTVSASAWSASSYTPGSGTNYNDLSNLPSINARTLRGSMTAADLGLIAAPTNPTSGYYLRYYGGGWTAQPISYNVLTDQPQIGGVTLSGNKTAAALGLATTAAVNEKITAPSTASSGNYLRYDGTKWVAGSGDTVSYTGLTNKPSINSVTLSGNKTSSDLGLVASAQGVAHAGEFLVVGSDGNVTTVTMTAWQGGSF